MSQTRYKLDNNKRGIVVRYCRLYDEYIKSNETQKVNIISIVSQEKFLIGDDIANDDVRLALRKAIWNSTCDAKDCPYEVHDLPTISRNEFYERKRKFIYRIACKLEI